MGCAKVLAWVKVCRGGDVALLLLLLLPYKPGAGAPTKVHTRGAVGVRMREVGCVEEGWAQRGVDALPPPPPPCEALERA